MWLNTAKLLTALCSESPAFEACWRDVRPRLKGPGIFGLFDDDEAIGVVSVHPDHFVISLSRSLVDKVGAFAFAHELIHVAQYREGVILFVKQSHQVPPRLAVALNSLVTDPGVTRELNRYSFPQQFIFDPKHLTADLLDQAARGDQPQTPADALLRAVDALTMVGNFHAAGGAEFDVLPLLLPWRDVHAHAVEIQRLLNLHGLESAEARRAVVRGALARIGVVLE